MSRALVVFVALTSLSTLAACNRRPSLDTPLPQGGDARSGSGRGVPPVGTACHGREDCSSDQVCVAGACRYLHTSVAGEVLATAAEAQVEAGDWEGAMRTYEQAMERFEQRDAPVPPEVLCASAALILRTATDAEARERGARRADQCFRASVPGSPERAEVRRAVARLRFEGLDVALFDRQDPAERFFTQEPSRPTVDALAIDIGLPESEEAGATQIREQLAGEAAHRAIAECFVQDWELRHQRSARASLVLRYATRLHDMGSYDVYEPEVTVEKTTVAEDGFEPCVARALGPAITAPRGSRVVAWQAPLEITAQVQ